MKLETRTEHIRHIRLAGDYNNNKMERLNGEIRDREKVMRGLETNHPNWLPTIPQLHTSPQGT
jgi:hypothetical protein